MQSDEKWMTQKFNKNPKYTAQKLTYQEMIWIF